MKNVFSIILFSVFYIFLMAYTLAGQTVSEPSNLEISSQIDPVTRYVYLTYRVPEGTADEIDVICQIRWQGEKHWNPAPVWPYTSETAQKLMQDDLWKQGINQGKFTELNAAGLFRKLVWNPFRWDRGCGTVDFKIELQSQGKVLAQNIETIRLQNEDVVILDDWSQIMQPDYIGESPEPNEAVWWYRTNIKGDRGPRNGTYLAVKEKSVELPQLTYPLDLNGYYAIFVCSGEIELRFSGDELTQYFGGVRFGTETFWCWKNLTREHLIVKQPYRTIYPYYKGDDRKASLDYVRLVPLTPDTVARLEQTWKPLGDKKLVIGYNEPYTWAFYRNIQNNLQHAEPPMRFAQSHVDILDIQVGRPGSLMNFETRVGEQHLWAAMGDGTPGEKPLTPNVGRMQQYTNMLGSQVKYAKCFGITPFVNMGATTCYVGEPDEAQFSKDHPEWRYMNFLKYDEPKVRKYVLKHFEEGLQIGAEGMSIDWTRYPHAIWKKETVTGFFRELRALADEYSQKRGKPVKILTRFSVPDSFWHEGKDRTGLMDYAAWCRVGLVDYICPSYYNDRMLHFPLEDYLAAVQDTKTKLVPCVGFVELPMPGMWLKRVYDCYQQGVDGIYIYQMEGLACDDPPNRRYVSAAHSAEWVHNWYNHEQDEQPHYSKRIYVKPASRNNKYRDRERLRVWVEGVTREQVELYIDGKIINRYEREPYVLTSEYHKDDDTIKPGKHVLKVRARDGQGWLEQEFPVEFDVR